MRTAIARRTRLPTCPAHLNAAATAEWRRIARALQQAGVLTTFDRSALAAYCQAWGRWVEAEERLRETPPLVRTPSGHVQQSPWLGIANRQLELMGRYMVELGLTPAARSRIGVQALPMLAAEPPTLAIEYVSVAPGKDGSPPTRTILGRRGADGRIWHDGAIVDLN